MSESVGRVLQAYGDASVQQTAKLILLVDKWFDCMNVRHIAEAGQKRKPALLPYTSAEDERFKVCISYGVYTNLLYYTNVIFF